MPEEVGEIKREGALAFPVEPEKETPASPPEDKKPDDTTGTSNQDKKPDAAPVPFHEHPRWKQRENEWQSKLDSMRTEYDDKLNKFAEATKPHEDPTIPQWFGGDKTQWTDFQGYLGTLKGEAKADAIREIKGEQEAEQAKLKAANDYIENEIVRLNADGKEFDRNELLKVVNDFRPVNEQGYWDFDKAYDILQMKKSANQIPPPDPLIRKQAGAIDKSSSKTDSSKKDFMTNEDFRKGGRPW